MTLTRRSLLAAAAAAGSTALLAGCAGLTGGGTSSSKDSKTITFTTWASDGEKAGYKKIIAKFEDANPGITVKLNVVPYAQMFTNVDAQLQAGNAPDVFRAGYGQIGGYSQAGQLMDLSSEFSSGEVDAFLPAFWEAVKYDGKPYGVPQQTDTSALVYNTKLMEQAGYTTFPDSLDNAWTWEEFDDVMAKLRSTLSSKLYPFAYNWQLAGSPRWLSWLFMADGRMLSKDLSSPAIDSDAGAKALDYTKSFFEKEYVPANSSTKSSAYADTTFLAGSTAMLSAGNFLLSEIAGAKFDWSVTYLPRDARASDDLGGNALVVNKDGNTDLAAKFVKFAVAEESMSTFCADAMELPTLQSLVGKKLDWQTTPDLMPTFVDQATTITASDVAQVTVPAMSKITTTLTAQLESAFRQGQSTKDTLAGISSGITKALA